MIEHMEIGVATHQADTLGESPTWVEADGWLWWIDLRKPCLHRLVVATGQVDTWPMREVIGAVVARRGGDLVLALKDGLHAFDPGTGVVTPLVRVEDGPPDNRLNDAKCDAAGRIWCGSMWDYGLKTSGGLYRIDPDLSVTRVRSGVTVANALAFSPDSRTIYFTDSSRGHIERAGFDLDSGAIGAWSVLADAAAAPGRPDGATVDEDGYVWNARYQGGCIARFAPDGRLDRLIELPVTQPTSCAFGGPERRTLYVTTATQNLSDEAQAAQPLAGALLALDVGVAGLPEPAFAG